MFVDDSKVEGSQATARLTAELLRSVVSLQRLPPINPAAVLIEAVRDIGVKLIAANPVGKYFICSYKYEDPFCRNLMFQNVILSLFVVYDLSNPSW